MKNVIRGILVAGALALGLVATEASAQANQEGLITVNINNVANNLARDLDVNVSQIPVTVQVPIGVAANVCNVSAAVLAQQRGTGAAPCEATSTNRALNQFVQRQLLSQ